MGRIAHPRTGIAGDRAAHDVPEPRRMRRTGPCSRRRTTRACGLLSAAAQATLMDGRWRRRLQAIRRLPAYGAMSRGRTGPTTSESASDARRTSTGQRGVGHGSARRAPGGYARIRQPTTRRVGRGVTGQPDPVAGRGRRPGPARTAVDRRRRQLMVSTGAWRAARTLMRAATVRARARITSAPDRARAGRPPGCPRRRPGGP